MMADIKAENLYPDDVNFNEYQGIKVRKGTMAAAIENIRLLSSEDASPEEKASARKMLTEYAPALIATGLNALVKWNHPEVQAIMDEAARNFDS